MGHPISHSTHCGFRLPPICSLKGLEFFACVASLALPLFQSRSSGVGYCFTKFGNSFLPTPALPRASAASGVGILPLPPSART
jgi:hypothetical protein